MATKVTESGARKTVESGRWLPEDYVAPVDAPRPNDLIDWWAPALANKPASSPAA